MAKWGEKNPFKTEKSFLMWNDFQHKGKQEKCKFTDCTSHRPHCLGERTLFAMDHNRFQKRLNKKEKTNQSLNLVHQKLKQNFKSLYFAAQTIQNYHFTCIFHFRVVLITGNGYNITNNLYQLEIERHFDIRTSFIHEYIFAYLLARKEHFHRMYMSTRMARSLQTFYRHLSCQSISLPSVYRLNLSGCCTPNQFRFYLPSSSLIPTTVLHSDKSKDEGWRAPRGTSSEFATRLFICCGGRIILSQCCVTYTWESEKWLFFLFKSFMPLMVHMTGLNASFNTSQRTPHKCNF